MHYVNSEDSAHQRYTKKWRVKQAVSGDDSGTDSGTDSETDPETDTQTDPETDSGTDGSPSLPAFPSGSTDEDPGPGCCSDPELSGEPGSTYRLDDGRVIRLERGDRICVNCETVHENHE